MKRIPLKCDFFARLESSGLSTNQDYLMMNEQTMTDQQKKTCSQMIMGNKISEEKLAEEKVQVHFSSIHVRWVLLVKANSKREHNGRNNKRLMSRICIDKRGKRPLKRKLTLWHSVYQPISSIRPSSHPIYEMSPERDVYFHFPWDWSFVVGNKECVMKRESSVMEMIRPCKKLFH